MKRDALTIAEIYAFRDSHPAGSAVVAPVERYVGNSLDQKRTVTEYRDAIILESHKRVAVTTVGTIQWAQLAMTGRGLLSDVGMK